MQEITTRITFQSVVFVAFFFLAAMVWVSRQSSGDDSDLVTTLRFAQMAIYGSLAFATVWFGLRAVRRGETQRRVSVRAIVVSVAVMLAIAAAGLVAAIRLA